MAVDPRILQMISNPTSGKLGEIGRTYAESRERDAANEALKAKAEKDASAEQRAVEKRAEEAESNALKMKTNLLSFDEKKKADNLSDATTLNSWIDAYKVAAQKGEVDPNDQASHAEYIKNNLQGVDDPDVLKVLNNAPPSAYPQAQKNALFAISTYTEASGEESFGDFAEIPGTKLYGQLSSKTGKYSNIRESVDGTSKMGNSEFERTLARAVASKQITQDRADELTAQRAKGFAGEMTNAQGIKLNEKQADRYNRETKDLRKEYTQGSDHFRGMGQTIDSAFAAMDSGDTKLSEVLLNQVMSQVQDTNVRAFQMYGEFDKGFGNLAQRVAGSVSRFVQGKRTETETEEIRNVLSKFNESYVKPAESKLRDRYRRIAIDQGKDPFQVVPPKDVKDVLGSSLLDNKQKAKKIKEFFPDWKPPK